MSDEKVQPELLMATLPKERKFLGMRPGYINYAAARDGGKYPGSKLERFLSIEALNEFAQKHANVLTLDIWLMSDDSIMVLYTNTLEGEEMEDFLWVQEEMGRLMAERKRNREEQTQKEFEAAEEKAHELNKLYDAGKKCLANHGKQEKMSKRIHTLEDILRAKNMLPPEEP